MNSVFMSKLNFKQEYFMSNIISFETSINLLIKMKCILTYKTFKIVSLIVYVSL